MRHFDEIYEIAAHRKGGPDELEALLPSPKPAGELAQVPEDRWLSQMAQRIFCAGFNWKVIDAKWKGFESSFKGFDVDACAMMDDVWFDQLLTDTAIVRHGGKIQSVRDNAVFCQELRSEGGIAKVVADWPSTDFAALLEMFKKRGTRLGGSTGPYMLRFMGRDSYILTVDVVARLVGEGVIDKAPTSKRAMTAVQEAFNTWMEQSGRGLSQISRVLAMSV